MKKIDTQYRDLLQKILEEGVATPVPQGVDALTVMAPGSMRFRLSEGFPVITERDLSKFWRAPIAEILAFAHGARTQSDLEKFGCKWWKAWVTPEKCAKRGLETGDLGPGSYGAAFHDFPMIEDEYFTESKNHSAPTFPKSSAINNRSALASQKTPTMAKKAQTIVDQSSSGLDPDPSLLIPAPHAFNQFTAIINQIKQRPELRTHFISPWIPQYTTRLDDRQQKVVVCPCHGWMHFRVIKGKLYLHMFQRSGDVPIGVPSNLIQYSALLLLVAHVTGLEPYEYIHTISDAHIYVDQIPAVKELLSRPAKPLPKIALTTEARQKTNFWDFTRDDFELLDYNPNPPLLGIPAAV